MSDTVNLVLEQEEEPLQEFVKNDETFEQPNLEESFQQETIAQILSQTKESVKESENTLTNATS